MKQSDCQLVSVVILNWNRKDDLKETLESVSHQTYNNFEIIVVDNGSTDGSDEMMEHDFPNSRLIKLERNTGIAGYNVGMQNSQGRYIAVLDNDVILEAHWLARAVEELDKDAQLGIIAGRVLNYYTKEESAFWSYGLGDDWVDKEFYTTVFIGCSAMIKREVFDKVGGYPEDYFFYYNEDVMAAKTVNAGYSIKYMPNILCYHKLSLKQRPRKNTYYYMWRNAYWFMWQYYPADLAIKYSLLHFFGILGKMVLIPLTFPIKLVKRNWSPLEKRLPNATENVSDGEEHFWWPSSAVVLVVLQLPLVFVRAHFDALRKLPRTVKNRAPIKDRTALKPVYPEQA